MFCSDSIKNFFKLRMKLFKVGTCCLCINLDVGTKIIGFVCTLFAALSAALYGVPAALVPLPLATTLFYGTAVVTSGLQLVTGCVMIVGLFQRRPGLLAPWLALSWAVGAALLLLALAGTLLLYAGARAPRSGLVPSAYAVYALILLYFAAVVKSRRDEMLDEEKWNSGKRLMRPAALNENVYV